MADKTFSDDIRLEPARRAILEGIRDCTGLAVLAFWVVAGHFDSRLVPDVLGFMNLAVFMLGFSTVFFPYSLYKAVRDFNSLRRDEP